MRTHFPTLPVAPRSSSLSSGRSAFCRIASRAAPVSTSDSIVLNAIGTTVANAQRVPVPDRARDHALRARAPAAIMLYV